MVNLDLKNFQIFINWTKDHFNTSSGYEVKKPLVQGGVYPILPVRKKELMKNVAFFIETCNFDEFCEKKGKKTSYLLLCN